MSRRIEPEDTSQIPAAQALLKYVREHHEKGGIPEFAEKHGLDRLKVQRAITTLKRIDVDFAFAIEDATSGAVKAADWRSPEDEAPPESERRGGSEPTGAVGS